MRPVYKKIDWLDFYQKFRNGFNLLTQIRSGINEELGRTKSTKEVLANLKRKRNRLDINVSFYRRTKQQRYSSINYYKSNQQLPEDQTNVRQSFSHWGPDLYRPPSIHLTTQPPKASTFCLLSAFSTRAGKNVSHHTLLRRCVAVPSFSGPISRWREVAFAESDFPRKQIYHSLSYICIY